MLKIIQSSPSVEINSTGNTVTFTQSYSFARIENIDISSETFFLSQFHTYREDKEVRHVSDETI
jgi:hypothetical protein